MLLSHIAILAFIQGLTEFLPVSSSGHLLAARYLFGFDFTNSVAIDGFLHLGTLCAVLFYYRDTWIKIAASVFRKSDSRSESRQLLAALIVATIPGALIGLFLQDHPWLLVSSPKRLAVELLITALLLGLADHVVRRQSKDKANLFDALVIGIAQVFALLPGISRSGITIAAGRARGLTRESATHFSFLMSAPIIAGAGLSSLGEVLATASLTPAAMVMGFLVSFASGLVAIYLVITVIKRVSFTPFIVYLVILAAVMWVQS